MTPRPYQNISLDKIEKGFQEFNKQLLVLPTGGGKTIVFSFLAKSRLPKRTLILAHRSELIDQAIDKLHTATGIHAQKEKAEFSATLHADVVVASIQTMQRRLDKWPADHFDLIVCDEAHHSISDSWQAVLQHFSSAKVLGVTATADRGDKRELGEYYENVAHEVGLFDLVNQNFLSPIVIRSVPLKISLDGVKQTSGDYDANDLGSVLLPYMDGIADSIKEYAAGRKTLVFLPLIATSKTFAAVCKAHGLRAEHVDGGSEDRAEKLAAFARGDFDILCNAMLLTEGYDEPSISCVVNLRPTRSRPLYAQIAGRGTRLAEGKQNLLLLDFLFTHERMSLVRPASLIARDEDEAEEITEASFAKEEQEGGGGEQDLQELAGSCRAEREQKLRDKLAAMANRNAKFISAEEFAVKYHNLELAEWQPTMEWHEKEMTPKQKEWVEKAGVNVDTVHGRGQASALLSVYFEKRGQEPATSGQKWVMRKAGFVSADGRRNADNATRDDAKQFFAAKNKSTEAVEV
jgi:superfamily II DNA or RNA helicase